MQPRIPLTQRLRVLQFRKALPNAIVIARLVVIVTAVVVIGNFYGADMSEFVEPLFSCFFDVQSRFLIFNSP